MTSSLASILLAVLILVISRLNDKMKEYVKNENEAKLKICGMLIIFFITTIVAPPAFCLEQQAVAALLDVKLAQKASVIEVVSVAGRLSHIEYPQPDVTADTLTSPLPRIAFIQPQLTAYGSLRKIGNNSFRRIGPGPGGLFFDLAAPGKVRDLLAYQSLVLEGSFSGRWSVALADEALVKQEDNALLGAICFSTACNFPLASIVANLDLSRSRYLVLRLESDVGDFKLKSILFARSELQSEPELRAAWLWDVRMAVKNPSQLLDRLLRHNINRLYLQINDELAQLAPFMKAAASRGVAIWALDGSPESVNDFSPLLQRIDAVAAFNRNHPDSSFAGFQLDVEPYLLKDFSLKREHYSKKFLELLTIAASHCHNGKFLLSAALPFWFNQLPVNGRNLSWEAQSILDEVVVMGYRTDYSELLEVTRSLLAAGEKLGKPVMLGVELMPVPDEKHDVLTRVPTGSPDSLLLAGVNWKHLRSYTVSGSRLSFALNRAALPDMLKKRPPFSSFKGWVLHSVEGLDKDQ